MAREVDPAVGYRLSVVASDLLGSEGFRFTSDIARTLGIEPRNFPFYTNGKARLSYEQMRILHAWGYSLDWYICGGPDESRFRDREAAAERIAADQRKEWDVIADGLVGLWRYAHERGTPSEQSSPPDEPTKDKA